MISEDLVASPGQYRTNDIDVIVPPSEIRKHMNKLITNFAGFLISKQRDVHTLFCCSSGRNNNNRKY